MVYNMKGKYKRKGKERDMKKADIGVAALSACCSHLFNCADSNSTLT